MERARCCRENQKYLKMLAKSQRAPDEAGQDWRSNHPAITPFRGAEARVPP
jgi:hypothetical protein